MKHPRLLCSVLLSALLAGCANVPVEPIPDSLPARTPENAKAAIEAAWGQGAGVLVDGRQSMTLIVPASPPQEIRERHVQLELAPNATVRDVVAVLGRSNVPVILADAEAGDKTFFLPQYKGTVGGLMSAVSRAADVWFTWHDGVIVVSSKERIAITLPQDQNLAKRLEAGLNTLKADDVLVSWDAGMLTAKISASNLAKTRAFLDRMTKNAALVTLQVAVVTVNLAQNAKQGIDWSRMQMSLGEGARDLGPFIQSQTSDRFGWKSLQEARTAAATTALGTTGTANTTATTGTAGSATATATATANLPAISAMTGLLSNGTALQGILVNKYFTLSSFVDYLSSYGVTETQQNVLLKTVTGAEVELKSVVKTPYVSSVGVGTTGGNVSTTNNAAGNASTGLLGGVRTETANDGVTLKMTPAYDAESSTVTVDMKLSIEAVLGFNNLQAGNQIGQLSQPTTAERSFNDILRLRPGETVVVGGITYDSVGRNRSGPEMLRDTDYASRTLTVNRTTMFIVLRPAVTVLGSPSERVSAPDLLLQESSGTAASTPVRKPLGRTSQMKRSPVPDDYIELNSGAR